MKEFNREIESLASKFHDIYMKEARRQGDIRHKDKYEDLSENIKEFDRVLARYVLANFQSQDRKVDEEYIEEKGNELWDWFEESLDGSYTITPHKCKDFIRSIVQEIQGTQKPRITKEFVAAAKAVKEVLKEAGCEVEE